MTSLLVGGTGFVGTTLQRQTSFDATVNSTTVGEIDGNHYDLVVCAAAPAQKWIANQDPEADRARIDGLITHLGAIKADRFVLISTVDVFGDPRAVDEESDVSEEGLHAYGLNRRRLERFVEATFGARLIVRLPGLVGPGLRKNVIFDLLNGKSLDAIDSRAIFQFYPMVNLWYDIDAAMTTGLELLHLTAEPVTVADVAARGFGFDFSNSLDRIPPVYDMRTRHATVAGGGGDYQYSARETIQAVRAYAQAEPRSAG